MSRSNRQHIREGRRDPDTRLNNRISPTPPTRTHGEPPPGSATQAVAIPTRRFRHHHNPDGLNDSNQEAHE